MFIDNDEPKTHYIRIEKFICNSIGPIKYSDNNESHAIKLVCGDMIRIENSYYKFIGRVNSIESIPISNVNCVYLLGDKLCRRKVNLKALETAMKKKTKISQGDEKLIDTTIRNNDNDLMILIKNVLKIKKITRDDFSKMFDNVSEMNNIRRQIEKENGGPLSWNKWNLLMALLKEDWVLQANILKK